MRTVSEIIKPMQDILEDIPGAIRGEKEKGRKIIGVFPIYAPEELIYAAGMLPVGCWGGQVTISQAATLLPPFACPVMQGITELSMGGTYSLLDAAVITSPCDTLKCFTQNFMRTSPDVRPIFCNYPQNNKLEGGVRYLYQQLKRIGGELEEVAGKRISNLALHDSIELYNENRAAMNRLNRLLREKPGILTAKERYTIMKSRWFMDKSIHTGLVKEICEALELLPASMKAGKKVVLAGIMTEPAEFIQVLDEVGMTVVADELAYESRQFCNPVSQDIDQYERLARQWQNVEGCSVVFDPDGKRGEHLLDLAKACGADGVLYCQMKFCEEEEFDFPYIQSMLEKAGIPVLNIEIDPLSLSQEQARTRLQAFGEQLEMTV